MWETAEETQCNVMNVFIVGTRNLDRANVERGHWIAVDAVNSMFS